MTTNTDLPALSVTPIGYMRTSHATKVEAPRQPAASDATGIIELLPGPDLQHAVEDLAGWERIWVIFWFDRNSGWRPKVLPPRSTTGRKGVLATRSPHRPNPLGLSVLRLVRVEGARLHVQDVDMLDGTPILDIKPYVAYTDAFPDAASGWLAERDPRPDHLVTFTDHALAQLTWIAQRSPLPLRDRIEATLRLGPQPHPYRRIKQGKDGLTLAVQDWRVDFRVASDVIEVFAVRSGYKNSQLEQAGTGDAGINQGTTLLLHREFRERFA